MANRRNRLAKKKKAAEEAAQKAGTAEHGEFTETTDVEVWPTRGTAGETGADGEVVAEPPTAESLSRVKRRRNTEEGHVVEWVSDGRIRAVPHDRLGRSAPAWTIKLHRLIGHIGGGFVFFGFVMVVWPALIAGIAALITMIMALLGPQVSSSMLEGSGVPYEVMVASSEQFLFGWVIPTLFGIIVGAIMVSMVFWALLKWCWGYTNRIRLGLYAGYGTSIAHNRAERSTARAVARANATSARTKRKNERDEARASAAKSMKETGV